jgi:hypothetical protein
LKFLGFRHVVRQVYGFLLDGEKVEEISSIFEKTVDVFLAEIERFCGYLKAPPEGK